MLSDLKTDAKRRKVRGSFSKPIDTQHKGQNTQQKEEVKQEKAKDKKEIGKEASD